MGTNAALAYVAAPDDKMGNAGRMIAYCLYPQGAIKTVVSCLWAVGCLKP